MKQILNLLTITACICGLALGAFEPTRKATMPANVREIEYSPDQKVLAASTLASLYLYNGVTLESIKLITYPTDQTFTSLSFSDEASLAVGFSSKNGNCNYQIYTTAKDGIVNGIGNLKDDFLGQVNSLCFSADNTYLILGSSKGEIILVRLADKHVTSHKFGDSISSVACSPIRTLQFAVAGNSQEGSPKLTFYNFEVDTGAINQQKNIDALSQTQTISNIRYSTSGRHLYRVGSSNKVYSNDVDTYGEEIIVTFDEAYTNFIKLRVTAKENVIAANTLDTLLVYFKDNIQNDNPQVIKTVVSTFSLGPHGANVAYFENVNQAQIAGQCPQTQFINEVTGACQSCEDNCQLCLEQPTCFLCKQAFYLSTANTCLECVVGCKACSNGNSCSTCYNGFILLPNNLCGCERGKYLHVNKCTKCPQGCLQCSDNKHCSACEDDYEKKNQVCQIKGGVPTWVIVLLIILGIAILVVISGIVFIKVRKSRKSSSLLADQDEVEPKYAPIKQ